MCESIHCRTTSRLKEELFIIISAICTKDYLIIRAHNWAKIKFFRKEEKLWNSRVQLLLEHHEIGSTLIIINSSGSVSYFKLNNKMRAYLRYVVAKYLYLWYRLYERRKVEGKFFSFYIHADLAHLARAPPCHGGGNGFKPRNPLHNLVC